MPGLPSAVCEVCHRITINYEYKENKQNDEENKHVASNIGYGTTN